MPHLHQFALSALIAAAGAFALLALEDRDERLALARADLALAEAEAALAASGAAPPATAPRSTARRRRRRWPTASCAPRSPGGWA